MRTFKLILSLTITALFLIGCSNEDLVEEPRDFINSENLLVDTEGFEAALAGLYNRVRKEHAGTGEGSNNNLRLEMAYSGTDVAFGLQPTGTGRTWNEFGERNNPSTGSFSGLWSWFYGIINGANYIILSAEDASIEIDEDDRNRILAEAKAFRAYAYRHLTNLFGDVPLNLQASNGTNIRTDWERTPVGEIRLQMEEDLIFAKNNLPATSSNNGKIVKGFAQHYLAELYLYTGEYAKARDEALELINSGIYTLVTERYGEQENLPGTPFSDMFIDGNSRKDEGNTEVIFLLEAEFQVIGGEGDVNMRRWWQARYRDIRREGITPLEVTLDRGGRGLGRLGMSLFMFNLYEEQDDRFSPQAIRQFFVLQEDDDIPDGFAVGDSIFLNTDDLVMEENPDLRAEWPYTRKWDSTVEEDVAGGRQYDDHVYLRLAETYLVLAEAYIQLNDNQAAADALNVLRERSNASLINAADVDIDFLLDERARELFTEGHRRYHLLRLNKWIERTQLYNPIAGPNITERDKLFPIPQDVIDANLTLEMPQNPGYE